MKNTTKEIILDIAADFFKNGLISSLGAVATGTAASTILGMPYIAIPVCLTAYIIYKSAGNKLSESDAKKNHDRLQTIIKENSKLLGQFRDTQITNLSNILETKLKIKASEEALQELKNIIIDTLEGDDKKFAEIARSLNVTNEEISALQIGQDKIIDFLNVISNQNVTTNAKLDSIQEDISELKRRCYERDNALVSYRSQPKYSLGNFYQCSTFPSVQTQYCQLSTDKSLDDAITATISAIEQGNFLFAIQKIDTIFSQMQYQGSAELMTWHHALIAFMCFRKCDKGNGMIAAKQAIDNFNRADITNPHPLLVYVLAQYYAANDNVEHAMELLSQSLQDYYTFENKALLISLSKNAWRDDIKSLTEEEKNASEIDVALANKCFNAGDYDDAVAFAKRAYENAQSAGNASIAVFYAEILFKRRFNTGLVTEGFMRPCLSNAEWPDAKLIIDLYNQAVANAFALSARTRSYVYYNLTMVHNICGHKDEARDCAFKFFEQNEVVAEAIDMCASVLISSTPREKHLPILEKFKSIMPTEAACHYANALLESNSEPYVAEGISILRNVIENALTPNTFSVFMSAMNLAEYFLDNNDSTGYSALILTLRRKHEDLSYLALEVQKNEKSAPAQARNSLLELVKYLPEEPLERGNIVLFLSRHFCALDERKVLLQLMDDFVPQDTITDAGRLYFNAALITKDLNRVHAFGEALRDSGVWDYEFICAEMQLTMLCSKKNAEHLANKCLCGVSDPEIKKLLTTFRDMAAISTDNFAQYQRTPIDYPTPDDALARESAFPNINVPIILSRAGFVDEAIKYAYDLHLRFPCDNTIAKIFIAVIQENQNAPCLTAPVSIDESAIFECRSLKSDQSFTVIVENYASSNPLFRRRDDSLVQLLWGAIINHIFNVTEHIAEPEYQITSIGNKYIAEMQTVMNRLGHTPKSGVELIETPETADGGINFSLLIQRVTSLNQRRNDNIESAKKLFRNIPSVYLFATMAGFDLKTAIRYIAQQSEVIINAASGAVEERNAMFSLLQSRKGILLSPLSLNILVLLDAVYGVNILDCMHKNNFRICISEYLMEELIRKKGESSSFQRLYSDGVNVGIVDDDIDRRCHASIVNISKTIQAHAEIIAGNIPDSDFNAHSGDKNKFYWGKTLYHTMSIANGDDMILWEDDSVTVDAFNKLYGFKISQRVFSQAVFMFLENEHNLSAQQYTNSTLLLLGINETFTSLNALALFDIFFNVDKNVGLKTKIEKYFNVSHLEQESLFYVLLNTSLIFMTKYTNTNRAKKGIVDFYLCAANQCKDLIGSIICYCTENALEKDKKLAIPIARHVRQQLAHLLSTKEKSKFDSLIR